MPTGIPKSGKRKKRAKVDQPSVVGASAVEPDAAEPSVDDVIDFHKDAAKELAIESAIEKVVNRRVDKVGEYWTKCLDDPVVLSCPEVVGLLRRGEFLIWCVNGGRLRIRESETMKTELGHMVTYYDRMEQ